MKFEVARQPPDASNIHPSGWGASAIFPSATRHSWLVSGRLQYDVVRLSTRTPGLPVSFLVFALLLSTGCGRSRQKTIAVIPKATSHIFWQSVQAGALAAGRELKVDILWNGPAQETEYSRQIQIVDSMIAQRVDGLAVAASDRTALNASLDRAAAAGIPVTIFDSGVDSEKYMTFVATNNYAAGQMAARKLGELLRRQGRVAIVLHAPGSFSTMERERGFEDVMKKEFPKIRIVARQFGMSDRAKAMAAAENMLTAHPGLNGMFASSEPSSVGASLALKGRGLGGAVRLVGFDASEGLVNDLRSGTIDALVVQDPFRIGYEAVRTLVQKLNGHTPPRQMDLDAIVVTTENADKPEVKTVLFPDVQTYLK
jgi:ribose transport system substrate-binding protein